MFLNLIKKSKKKAKVNSKVTSAMKKTFSELEEKGIFDYCEIVKTSTSGDKIVDESFTMNSFENTELISIIVLATRFYFSDALLFSIKQIANENPNVQIIFGIDRVVKKEKSIKDKLDILKKCSNVRLNYYSRGVRITERLRYLTDKVQSDYVLILSLKDELNPRSSVMYLSDLLNSKSLNIKNYIKLFQDQDNKYDLGISSVTGIIFNTNYIKNKLYKLNFDIDFYLSEFLLENNDENASYRRYYEILEKSNIYELSAPDIGYLISDTLNILNSTVQIERKELYLKLLLNYSKKILESDMSILKQGLLASGIAYVISKLYYQLSHDSLEDILKFASSIFQFGRALKNNKINLIHKTCIEKIIDVQPNTIGVIETDFMTDIKNSLLADLETKFKIIYVTKPQYYDYHWIYCMVLRCLLQPASIVVSSNDIHKYITQGKSVFTIWHGLGMLKKIASVDRSVYPMNYIVTSSEGCVDCWSEIFQLPKDKVLPFGTPQTDRLYDENYLHQCRSNIQKKYNLEVNSRIVFFAPTFRNDTHGKFYNFYLDIEELSKELEKNNIYILAKKHHVFSHIEKDKKTDKSGLSNSKNGRFIIAKDESFTELIAACDIFMTDYSSGLFYAFVRNIPSILYAPDLAEYKKGANGLLIDYPYDIPANFVDKPNIKKLIEAICKPYDVNSDEFNAFKFKHVGACDGNSSKKIIDYLSNIVK